MKKVEKLKLSMTMAVCFIVALFATSCSNDYFFGFEDDSVFINEKLESNQKYLFKDSLYLDISSYDFNNWTIEDIQIMTLVEKRMGVSFINNKYYISAECGNDINVSDALYCIVRNQFELTNSILNDKSNRDIKRTKRSDPEPCPDCVPIAISHMGQDAPSYDEAVAKCDERDPNWRQNNGVATSKVHGIISEFTNVGYVKSMDSYTTVTNLNNCVLLIYQNETTDHAVNALYYDPAYGILNLKKIIYVDYSKNNVGETGRISPKKMTLLFPFI